MSDAHSDDTTHERTTVQHTRDDDHADADEHADHDDEQVDTDSSVCACGLDDVPANAGAHDDGCYAHLRYHQHLARKHGIDPAMILRGISGSGVSESEPDSEADIAEVSASITTNDSRDSRPAGYLERSIRADIADLGEGAIRGRSAYVALAVTLGRVLDREADEVGVTAMAKAADALRVIMDVLNRPQGDESTDLLEQLLATLSTPTVPTMQVTAKPPPDTSWLQTPEVIEGDKRRSLAPPT